MLESKIRTFRNHSSKKTKDSAAPDKILLQRWYQYKDKAALTELFRLHQESIYRTAVRYVGTDSADDIVQAVFISLVRKSSTFQDQGNPLRTWLMGITVRTCLKNFRAARRKGNREKKLSSLNERAENAMKSRMEIATVLKVELEQLPEKYRRPLELRYLEGFSVKDVACILNAKANTTNHRISRGLKKLRERLADYDVATTSAFCISILGEIPTESAPNDLILELQSQLDNKIFDSEIKSEYHPPLKASTQTFSFNALSAAFSLTV